MHPYLQVTAPVVMFDVEDETQDGAHSLLYIPQRPLSWKLPSGCTSLELAANFLLFQECYGYSPDPPSLRSSDSNASMEATPTVSLPARLAKLFADAPQLRHASVGLGISMKEPVPRRASALSSSMIRLGFIIYNTQLMHEFESWDSRLYWLELDTDGDGRRKPPEEKSSTVASLQEALSEYCADWGLQCACQDDKSVVFKRAS